MNKYNRNAQEIDFPTESWKPQEPTNEPVMFSRIESMYTTRLFLDLELNFNFWAFLPSINLNVKKGFVLEIKWLCLSIYFKNK
jgi:hypothetical protein